VSNSNARTAPGSIIYPENDLDLDFDFDFDFDFDREERQTGI